MVYLSPADMQIVRPARTLAGRWWVAIRPHSLGTALAPVLVGGGAAVHDGAARPWAFALAGVGVALLLVGVNLANDYFDYRSGADPPLGVGLRPLQAGVLSPRAFLVGSLVAFAGAGGCGLVLAWSSPCAVLLLGLSGGLLGFFYTAPPLRLGYRGLGEIVVFLTLGIGATLGADAVTAGRFGLTAVWGGVPLGLTVAALLHANNLRDRAEDARSGKRTLAVRLGERWARREFALLVWSAVVAGLGVAIAVTPFAALSLLTAPWAWRLGRSVLDGPLDGRALMRQTARLHLRLALALAVGLALGGILG